MPAMAPAASKGLTIELASGSGACRRGKYAAAFRLRRLALSVSHFFASSSDFAGSSAASSSPAD